MNKDDTIVAVATPPGMGGVGIVRLSGKKAYTIHQAFTQKTLTPNEATFIPFLWKDAFIDEGIAIYFKNPRSYTGEDVIEWQVHGSPWVLDQLVNIAIELGARIAEPGEFTKRAFLNGKLDLAQAEAVSDLIHAQSESASRMAARTLKGAFSREVHQLVNHLTTLRAHIESMIDFSDEDIPGFSNEDFLQRLNALSTELSQTLQKANDGLLIQEGLRVALIGPPNAGKSSLLNYLAREDKAIVTPIPGTTRDIVEAHIQYKGLPLHLVDTAGIRVSDCEIENIGIQKSKLALSEADVAWVLLDASKDISAQINSLNLDEAILAQSVIVANKSDIAHPSDASKALDYIISAKTGEGIDELLSQLDERLPREGQFSAKRRHVDALKKAECSLENAKNVLANDMLDLAAMDLRLAQEELGTIVGITTADDLLGAIFSEFCIGK